VIPQSSLQASARPYIDVHKTRSCVETATPPRCKAKGSIPEFRGGNPGRPNVNGHPLHMQTMASDPRVQEVHRTSLLPGRAVTADSINFKVALSERGYRS